MFIIMFRDILAYFRQFTRFDKNIKLLLLSNLLTATVAGLISVIEPLYLKGHGLDTPLIWFVISISSITSFIVLLPAGIITDHYGPCNTKKVGSTQAR